MSNSLSSYLLVSAALFSIGIFGVLTRRNLVAMLISLELVLNSVSVSFMAFNRFVFTDKTLGQVFVIFIIALAAAEVSIALSLVLWLYRKRGSINMENAKDLRG